MPVLHSFDVERDFPGEIKKMRTECGLSQEELAKEIGLMTAVSICLYESGKRQPSIQTFWRICSVCNYSLIIQPN